MLGLGGTLGSFSSGEGVVFVVASRGSEGKRGGGERGESSREDRGRRRRQERRARLGGDTSGGGGEPRAHVSIRSEGLDAEAAGATAMGWVGAWDDAALWELRFFLGAVCTLAERAG